MTDARHLPVMAFHLYLPHPELLRALFPLSAFLPQKMYRTLMQSVWTEGVSGLGPGAYWGLLFRRHTEICRPPGLEVPPELSLHPTVPSGALYFPLRAAQPPSSPAFILVSQQEEGLWGAALHPATSVS